MLKTIGLTMIMISVCAVAQAKPQYIVAYGTAPAAVEKRVADVFTKCEVTQILNAAIFPQLKVGSKIHHYHTENVIDPTAKFSRHVMKFKIGDQIFTNSIKDCSLPTCQEASLNSNYTKVRDFNVIGYAVTFPVAQDLSPTSGKIGAITLHQSHDFSTSSPGKKLSVLGVYDSTGFKEILEAQCSEFSWGPEEL